MNELDGTVIAALVEALGHDGVFTDAETLLRYGSDHCENLSFPPAVLVKPSSTQQVSDIMRVASGHGVPVTPIGALTGLSGGALCAARGIGLSTERLNRILEIDEQNLQATVEPGVVTEEFQMAVRARGLFYPPDPASRGSCTLGGNVAENSGGPKALKYGVTRDYVLNLEVVLPSGEVLWTGANTLKNSTGYNLTQLMVGSEGTLAVITKIRMKLLPHPQHDLLLLAPFASALAACTAVSAIFKAGFSPSALEFMEREAVLYTAAFMGEQPFPVAHGDEAFLLIEVDGNDPEAILRDLDAIADLVTAHGAGELLLADDQSLKDRLWKLRRRIGEAVKSQSVYKEEDTVVPRFALPELLREVKRIGAAYGFRSVCYGHAGDGNLHVNILKESMSDEQWNGTVRKAIRELFEVVKSLGGTISGEHGIGLVQREYLDVVFAPAHFQLLRAIKSAFDPQGILNPKKILPEA